MHGYREFHHRRTLSWEQIVPFTDWNSEQSDPKYHFAFTTQPNTRHSKVEVWARQYAYNKADKRYTK